MEECVWEGTVGEKGGRDVFITSFGARKRSVGKGSGTTEEQHLEKQ